MHLRPEICQQPTIGAPVDLMPKLRQDLRWGRETWQQVYRGLRSHVEGLNGRVKNVDTFLDKRELRQSRGRVAQTLLAAVQLMVENLRTIEVYLRERRLWAEDRYTLAGITDTPDPHVPPAAETPTTTPHSARSGPGTGPPHPS
ncbi:hypothetical protein ACF9IK_14780 [Kitasatospora hibisci]|uniref:hypothetical protein n=1 Tax=Kitasatospora hibisci TaxID=3369522 RepID=UPI0037551466